MKCKYFSCTYYYYLGNPKNSSIEYTEVLKIHVNIAGSDMKNKCDSLNIRIS